MPLKIMIYVIFFQVKTKCKQFVRFYVHIKVINLNSRMIDDLMRMPFLCHKHIYGKNSLLLLYR